MLGGRGNGLSDQIVLLGRFAHRDRSRRFVVGNRGGFGI